MFKSECVGVVLVSGDVEVSVVVICEGWLGVEEV